MPVARSQQIAHTLIALKLPLSFGCRGLRHDSYAVSDVWLGLSWLPGTRKKGVNKKKKIVRHGNRRDLREHQRQDCARSPTSHRHNNTLYIYAAIEHRTSPTSYQFDGGKIFLSPTSPSVRGPSPTTDNGTNTAHLPHTATPLQGQLQHNTSFARKHPSFPRLHRTRPYLSFGRSARCTLFRR